MKSADNIRELIKRLRIRPDADADRKIHDDILRALEEWEQTRQTPIKHNIGRIIMKSQITKFAAAAAILTVAGLLIAFLGTSKPAYGLAQTIEANRGMRYLHTKRSKAPHEEPAKECWLAFDEAGRPKAVRIQWAERFIGVENIVVWTEAETKSWYMKHNCLHIFNDQIYTSRIHSMTENEDLRLMVEYLHRDEAKGQVEVEIDEPSGEGEPIVVTATYLPGSEKYGMRTVLFVDRATKLVTSMELYFLKEGEYKYYWVITYHDYNVPIDDEMFSMDDEIPPDAECIRTATDDIGLPQGNLSDDEIAVEVVRQYLEAVIAEDFVRACQMWDLTPSRSPAEIQSRLGGARVVRIVSIGEPEPHPRPSKLFPKMKEVPFTVEFEKNGTKQLSKKRAKVRPILGRRERWAVQGPRF
jgi:hypothetical protein